MQKLAIVGFGFMGITHALNVLNHPGAQLVAIVDLDPQKAFESLGQEDGNLDTGALKKEDVSHINTYITLEKCIAEEKPDACILSVHTDLHYSLAVQVLEAGFSVNFEKASIKYSSSSPEYITIATDAETLQVPAGDAMDGYSEELGYFVECLDHKTQPELCLPESALQSIRICYEHL